MPGQVTIVTNDTPEQARAALSQITGQGAPTADASADATATATDTTDANAASADQQNPNPSAAKPQPQPSSARPAPKGVDQLQERLDYVTFQKNHLMTERERLRQEVADLRSRMSGNQSTSSSTATPAAPKFDKPEPRIDDFTTVEEWTRAMVEHTRESIKFELEQRESSARQSTEQERQQADWNRVVTAHLGRLEEFRKAHPDYDDIANRAVEAEVPITPVMQVHVVNSDMGPAILYYLAQHPEEARRIATLPSGACWAALGRIEARIEAQNQQNSAANGQPASNNGQPAARPATSGQPALKKPVPAPIKPVGGNQTVGHKDPSEMTFQEWKEHRRAQGRR